MQGEPEWEQGMAHGGLVLTGERDYQIYHRAENFMGDAAGGGDFCCFIAHRVCR